jgi:alanine dehydrogenase|tara:strand:+ start:968 stop:1405 length:438 start_codon:yes stop_codon:yes gene_type:complete
MSIGIVLPSVLYKIGVKMGADLKQSDNFHVSTNYKSAKSMITDMDRPRQIITLLPTKAKDPEETLESLVKNMGPLDVVLDCMIDTPDRIHSRSELCFKNSTQYMAINITRECIYASGTRMVYLENKNLLRKINKNVKYIGGIDEV